MRLRGIYDVISLELLLAAILEKGREEDKLVLPILLTCLNLSIK